MKTCIKLAVCSTFLFVNVLHSQLSAFNSVINKTNRVQTNHKWQAHTIINTCLTTGAFSQQYFKFLRTDIGYFIFFPFQIKVYEYAVVRHQYYLPSLGLTKVYSKNNFTNMKLSFDFHCGVSNANNKMIGVRLFTSRFNYNKKYFGFGMGFTIGNKLYQDYNIGRGENKSLSTNYASSRFITDLRVGRMDVLYFEISRMNPATLDDIYFTYGLGSGFGSTNKFAIRLGVSVKHSANGYYSEFKIPLNQSAYINLFGGYTNNIKRRVAVMPNSEKFNEVISNAWFAGFKMNWIL